MPDLISRLILESETNNADKELANVRKEQERLTDAIADSTRIYGKASDETRDLVKQLKEQRDLEESLLKKVERTNDAYGERANVLKATEKFDRTSQGVALAGDVESNLRTVGGAAGAFGFSGAERLTSQASEIFAVTEAIPRLKESFAGMPAVLAQVESSVGAAGLAFAGIAVAAVIAKAVADTIVAEWQRVAETVKSDAETLRQTNQEIAQGLTSEGLQQKIDDLNRSRQAEEQTLADLEAEYQRSIEGRGALTVVSKIVRDEEEARFEQINKSKKIIEQQKRDLEGLNAFLESGRTATNDAAQAEMELAQTRTDGVATTTKAEQGLSEQRNIEAQVTQASAEASKRATEAERNRNKAIQEAERALEKQRQAQQRNAQIVASAKTDFQNAIQDIQQNFRDSAIDNQEETRRDLSDLARDYDREEQQSAREQNRELSRIRDDADKQESDAIRSRNFAALADAKQDSQDAIQEAKQSFIDEGQERRIEAEDQRRDIVTEAQHTTRDLDTETSRQQRNAQIALQRQIASAKQKLSFEQQAYNQSLKLTQDFGNSLVGLFQNMANQVGGINGRGTNSANIDRRLNDLTGKTSFGVTG